MGDFVGCMCLAVGVYRYVVFFKSAVRGRCKRFPSCILFKTASCCSLLLIASHYCSTLVHTCAYCSIRLHTAHCCSTLLSRAQYSQLLHTAQDCSILLNTEQYSSIPLFSTVQCCSILLNTAQYTAQYCCLLFRKGKTNVFKKGFKKR